MTNAEVAQFVEMEIASRYRSIDDTVRGDWVRAVWKAGDIEIARQIIRDIVDDPECTLTVKHFYGRLKARRKPAGARPEILNYDPYVRCLEAPADHPTWQDRQWFVMGGVKDGDLEAFRRANSSNKQYVQDWAQTAAKHFQQHHGGQWCGVVCEASNQPSDEPGTPAQKRERAERDILDGPDTPGRRWLLQQKGSLTPDLKSVPPLEPPRQVATRDMIERLRAMPNPEPRQPERATPEWFEQEDREQKLVEAREPGQEG